MLGNFMCVLLSGDFFSKSTFSKKSVQKNHQQFGSRSIWVQTVCKDYQQMKQVDKESTPVELILSEKVPSIPTFLNFIVITSPSRSLDVFRANLSGLLQQRSSCALGLVNKYGYSMF